MSAINPYIANGELKPAQARAKFCHLKANFSRSPIAESLSIWVEDNYPDEPVYKAKYLLLMAKSVLSDSLANAYTWHTIDEQRAFCRACEFSGKDAKFALAAIEKAIELGYFVVELYEGKNHLFCPEVQEDLREYHYKIVRQTRVAAEQQRNTDGKFVSKNTENNPENLTILNENEENTDRYNGTTNTVTTASQHRYNGKPTAQNKSSKIDKLEVEGENSATNNKNTQFKNPPPGKDFTVATVTDIPLQRLSETVEKKRKETNYYFYKINNNKKNTKICETLYYYTIYEDLKYFSQLKEKIGINSDDQLCVQLLIFDNYISEIASEHDRTKTISNFTNYVSRFMAWQRTNAKKELLSSMELSLLQQFNNEQLTWFFSGIAAKVNFIHSQEAIIEISVHGNKNKFIKIVLSETFVNANSRENILEMLSNYFSLLELKITKMVTSKDIIISPNDNTQLTDKEQTENFQKLQNKLKNIYNQ